jgi:hypothetical protein
MNNFKAKIRMVVVCFYSCPADGGIFAFERGVGRRISPASDELFSCVLGSLRAQTCEIPLTPVDACPEDQKRWLGIGEYFDTDNSTLNPYNSGYSFFVYGTFPLTITRFIAEAFGADDLETLKFLSREMSALADLFTIFILYLMVSGLYGRRIGLFAATFSSLAVMQIQQSHFFTTDLFTNMFMFLALGIVMLIVEYREKSGERDAVEYKPEVEEEESEGLMLVKHIASETHSSLPEFQSTRTSSYGLGILFHPLFLLSIGFGLALGMAMASKINAAALAFMLRVLLIRYFCQKDKAMRLKLILICLVAGGIAAIISFHFQPYAFSGLGLNRRVASIAEQRAQAAGSAHPDCGRAVLICIRFKPDRLGAWALPGRAGFFWMGWRILKGSTNIYCYGAGRHLFWLAVLNESDHALSLPVIRCCV